MKQLTHLESIVGPWAGDPIRYSPLARVFLLIFAFFFCIAPSQTARAANPNPIILATKASDDVRDFRNRPLVGSQPTIVTFDAPGAGTGPGQGTIAFAINPAGTISGRYADASGAIHAILRYPNGAIIAFDAPGAGTGPRQGTRPFSINPAGATAGYYNDTSGVFHGFLRTPDGEITTFNVPGAGTGPGQGTFAGNINPLTAVAGRYVDASGVAHGFLRAPDGTITTFDAPNAGTGPGQGTIIFTGSCLNPGGAIAATSIDAGNVAHGILRAPDGTMTTFDAPSAGTSPGQGTSTFGINQAGAIEGSFVDPSDVSHGFVRASDGTITTFDVPGAGTGPGQGTVPENISAPGVVTGEYVDLSNASHGFVRASDSDSYHARRSGCRYRPLPRNDSSVKQSGWCDYRLLY